jgi:3-oxoacyl-[acyl-carrier protein] reductase
VKEESMNRLENKRAVVTGGGSGIGRASALRLASEGARVAILDVTVEKARAVLADGGPARHLGFACNIADSAAVNNIFDEIDAAWGGIDILVNNAGIGRGPDDGSDQMYGGKAERAAQLARGEAPTAHGDQTMHCSDAGWAHVLGVNLNGAFYCTRAALRLMARDGTKGSIINICSSAAASGDGPIHYTTSKAALVGFTRGLALEVATRGIRVNGVHPGPTATSIMTGLPDSLIQHLEATVPLGRMAQPEEVAAAVAFLASDDASYATGSVLTVNGGSYFC